jgi:putative transcriptional regulator
MKTFDETCLEPATDLAPEEIRALRQREQVSQPVFARYLNVSRNIISDWERGIKRPSGPALRLLHVIRKHGLDVIA